MSEHHLGYNEKIRNQKSEKTKIQSKASLVIWKGQKLLQHNSAAVVKC